MRALQSVAAPAAEQQEVEPERLHVHEGMLYTVTTGTSNMNRYDGTSQATVSKIYDDGSGGHPNIPQSDEHFQIIRGKKVGLNRRSSDISSLERRAWRRRVDAGAVARCLDGLLGKHLAHLIARFAIGTPATESSKSPLCAWSDLLSECQNLKFVLNGSASLDGLAKLQAVKMLHLECYELPDINRLGDAVGDLEQVKILHIRLPSRFQPVANLDVSALGRGIGKLLQLEELSIKFRYTFHAPIKPDVELPRGVICPKCGKRLKNEQGMDAHFIAMHVHAEAYKPGLMSFGIGLGKLQNLRMLHLDFSSCELPRGDRDALLDGLMKLQELEMLYLEFDECVQLSCMGPEVATAFGSWLQSLDNLKRLSMKLGYSCHISGDYSGKSFINRKSFIDDSGRLPLRQR